MLTFNQCYFHDTRIGRSSSILIVVATIHVN